MEQKSSVYEKPPSKSEQIEQNVESVQNKSKVESIPIEQRSGFVQATKNELPSNDTQTTTDLNSSENAGKNLMEQFKNWFKKFSNTFNQRK